MRKSKFTGDQIAFTLKQAELGTSVEEVCRKMGISDATLYVWRKKYASAGPSELRRLRQLEEENCKLKQMRCEGHTNNVKRIYRSYREEGLSLRLKPPQRNMAAELRQPKQLAHAINEI